MPKGKEDISTNSLGEFSINNVNEIVYNMIESFRPFGITNPYPLFTFSNINILNIVKMGKNKEFTKLVVGDNINNMEVVIFVDFENVNIGDIINFTATISKNEFRGEVKFNLMLKELL